MTVGPSGVIWAVGSGKNLEDDTKHNNILTRFSPTGNDVEFSAKSVRI
jgi:hypothetical protein